MASLTLPHVARSCCVCGSSARDVLHEIRDPERLTGSVNGQVQPVTTAEQIVRCRTCGLQYVHPVIVWPIGSRAHTLNYDLDYFDHTRFSRQVGNTHLLRLVQRLLKKRGSWLDVGAGDGLLVSQAQASGWEALGIDIDAELVAALGLERASPPIQVIHLQDADLDPGSFAVISLVNVLEHVEAPDEMVAACTRLLRAGGLLVIHVPNVGSLGAMLRGASWRHYEPLSHLTFFDRHTLARLLERFGLEPLTLFSLPGSSRLKRSILALSDRLRIHLHDGLGLIARK